jgi:formylglycine-generating enzyme required for sulfatase activity
MRVETSPPGATVVLSQYHDSGDGHLIEGAARSISVGETQQLAAGSYLAVATFAGRATTRYPFTIDRGEDRALRIVLPRSEDVPEGMIYISAGRFLYGSGDDEATRAFFTHQPMRGVELPAFLVARTETTWRNYIAFLRALPEEQRTQYTVSPLSFDSEGHATLTRHGVRLAQGATYCLPQGPCTDWLGLPVDHVSRADAAAYADWLSRSGSLAGARLCTDREWERSARGADARRYSWGSATPGPAEACSLTSYGEMSRAGTCEPSTHPLSRSPFGVDDIAGNVEEWTGSPPDPASSTMGILRGGGYFNEGLFLAVCNRNMTNSELRGTAVGFRICADAR